MNFHHSYWFSLFQKKNFFCLAKSQKVQINPFRFKLDLEIKIIYAASNLNHDKSKT